MGKIIWIIGLPCSGKTTIAQALAQDIGAEVLDGDDIRGSQFTIGTDTGFSEEQREHHLLRVNYMAQRLAKHTNVICAFIAPFSQARKRLTKDLLVYLNPPASVCEQRDVKGDWMKARKHRIKNFTGVSQEFQAPDKDEPCLKLDTSVKTVAQCIAEIKQCL